MAAILVVIAGTAGAWSSAPAPMTSLRQIHALSNGEGDKGYAVAFEATVTFYRSDEHMLFVQDGDVAICISATTDLELLAGDRVLIRGITAGSFNPIIISKDITVLQHGTLPKSVPATFKELVKGEFDCRLVTVRGVIRAADLEARQSWQHHAITEIQFSTDSGPVRAFVDTDDLKTLRGDLDSSVEITGVSAGMFDDKMQMTGTVLYVPSLAHIKALTHPKANPWSVPVTPLDKILASYDMSDRTPRIRVHGIITYYQPGHAIVLQDGLKSLWVQTLSNESLRIGDQADAIGFTDAHDRFMSLIDAEILDSHIASPITPRPSTWKQLAEWSSNSPDGHQNDLVSIEGRVITEVREATQDEFVVDSDGGLFTAIYRHPPSADDLPPMVKIALGSRIRLTGICTRTDTKSAIPGKEEPFDILLRSFDDIEVLAKPSLLNIRNLILVVGVLFGIIIAVGIRGWAIERNVRRQTTLLAALERRRSRILEEINGSRPLAEILEGITKLASFQLNDAPCWCDVTNGARLGNYPQNQHQMRIVSEEIPARSGPPLGTISVALSSLTPPNAEETDALLMSAKLATLAIETRRLYSDLLHRSEFDLLTDIHNRFSLEKRLSEQISDARATAAIFGLIYIDLDGFKQINDIYGHQIGDLYLQAVAQRMKSQLRPHDTFARLGGDEFAALVPIVRSRAEVEEIAQRLERCFDEPIPIENLVLRGAASIGLALYPEDGTNTDSLLNAADVAMYSVKKAKKQAAELAAADPASVA
ncbi:MAG: GGDEF domain-containing protein [Terracidiphilus sp.]